MLYKKGGNWSQFARTLLAARLPMPTALPSECSTRATLRFRIAPQNVDVIEANAQSGEREEGLNFGVGAPIRAGRCGVRDGQLAGGESFPWGRPVEGCVPPWCFKFKAFSCQPPNSTPRRPNRVDDPPAAGPGSPPGGGDDERRAAAAAAPYDAAEAIYAYIASPSPVHDALHAAGTAYAGLIDAHPLATKSVTNALVGVTGDAIAQRGQVYDRQRAARYALKGLGGGLLWAFYFDFADAFAINAVDGPAARVALQMALEQFFWVPLYVAFYDLPFASRLNGVPARRVPNVVRDSLRSHIVASPNSGRRRICWCILHRSSTASS